jgi:L-fuculose-phosphate aldolase
MFATTLACLRRDVPPFHYMIAVAGGDSLRCAPYALFGTQALSDGALIALQDRKACLLANHGMIAVGRDLEAALAMALEVETLCEQYWRTLQVGGPALLTAQEMDEALEQFKDYGRWRQES